MALLTLYHDDAPDKALDSVTVGDTPLKVGRDPGLEGWRVGAQDRAVSRTHFSVHEAGGCVWVEDLSSNGLCLASGPVLRGAPVAVPFGETLRFGSLRVVVTPDVAEQTAFLSPFAAAAEGLRRPAGGPASTPPSAADAAAPPPAAPFSPACGPADPAAPSAAASDPTVFEGPFVRPLLAPAEPTLVTLFVPSDWAGAPTATPPAAAAPRSDAALLEAFCSGAKLDMSAFAGEDPVATMRELGAVYRQMVLGLHDLMSERISVKSEYRMTRTTVHAVGNNPFKWAPAQRVAVDLLRPRTDGFLSGPAAVNDSFTDLKKHLLALLAGFREAVSCTLGELAPGKAEARAETRGFSLKTRGQAAWEAYGALHAELSAEAHSDPEGRVNQGFRDGYERRLTDLDAAAPARARA